MDDSDYVVKGGQRLRYGFTTGSCAALAARAATTMLLTGERQTTGSIVTPNGRTLWAPILEPWTSQAAAGCSVKKAAGDDPDVTDGILVSATVRHSSIPGITIDGGNGIGRVTKPGLDQPIGAAAINTVPRQMITNEVQVACNEANYSGGLTVIISIPAGERLAAKTFNPHLGIVGGLSILGTSGLVEPMSTRAIIDTIVVELRVLRAEGARQVVIVPGNYGRDYAGTDPLIQRLPLVRCANFFGEALDAAVRLGFANVVLVGHLGKMIKLSGGVMDTHSSVADCRMELLGYYAALAGAPTETVALIASAATVDDALNQIDEPLLKKRTVAGILAGIDRYCDRRTGITGFAGAMLFSNRFGHLGRSPHAEAILYDGKSGE